jgi:type I restriction enzyme S subunit
MSWKHRPIAELVEQCRTWNPAGSKGSFAYIDLSSVDKDAKAITQVETLPCDEAPSRARQLIALGDVLIATVRPNLNGVALVEELHDGMTASTGYCVLRPRGDVLASRYLFHWVRAPRFVDAMVKVATGANYPAVSDAKVKDSLIPLPPLPEQKRIAAILDAADALSAKRRESIEQLDSLVQATFLEMFGDPVTNPKGWEVQPLGRHMQVKHGFAFQSKYFCDRGPFVLLTPGNFYEAGGYRDRGDKQKFYDGPVPDGFVLEENDLLVAMTEQAPGLLGSPLLVPESGRYLHNQRLGKLMGLSALSKWFWCHLFNSKAIRDHIQRESTGSKVKHTSPARIESIQCGLPPTDLQRHFSSIVESIDQQKARLKAHLAELDTLFASLQSRAFNGELVA